MRTLGNFVSWKLGRFKHVFQLRGWSALLLCISVALLCGCQLAEVVNGNTRQLFWTTITTQVSVTGILNYMHIVSIAPERFLY